MVIGRVTKKDNETPSVAVLLGPLEGDKFLR